MINTNLPSILHRFRDIAANRSEIAILGYPSCLTPPADGFPWDDLCDGRGRVWAVYTAVYGPYTYTSAYTGPCTRPYLRPCTRAVSKARRPCTGRVYRMRALSTIIRVYTADIRPVHWRVDSHARITDGPQCFHLDLGCIIWPKYIINNTVLCIK